MIFKDNEDYEKLIQIIRDYKEVYECEIYTFCLMINHIYSLIKEGKEDLGIAFRRIGGSYVYWYNLRHKRSEYLFQDRYKCEVVENQNQIQI